jgi:hypothetical protein
VWSRNVNRSIKNTRNLHKPDLRAGCYREADKKQKCGSKNLNSHVPGKGAASKGCPLTN